MFYFGNTFYVDKRQHDNVDYSEPVREWGKANNVQFGDTLAMEDIRVDELQLIRMGYPYLFVHQGSCEHLVIISDARSVTDIRTCSQSPTVSYLLTESLLCLIFEKK